MGSTGREAEVARADFPDGFVFGVATSAYQVPDRPTPISSRLASALGRLRLAPVPLRAPRLRGS